MKTKKTQQEIIVTVLLVLIAIAAVVLISNFVINMVKERSSAGESQVKCLGIDFTINPVSSLGNMKFTRSAGNSDVNITGVKVLVDGVVTQSYTLEWPALESKSLTVNSSAKTNVVGSKVSIAPILKGGVACEARGEVTAA